MIDTLPKHEHQYPHQRGDVTDEILREDRRKHPEAYSGLGLQTIDTYLDRHNRGGETGDERVEELSIAIDQMQGDVAEQIGVDSRSPDAVAATDYVLVREVEEKAMGNPDFSPDDALGVFTAAALEADGQRTSSEDNPVRRFEENHPDIVTDGIAWLDQLNAHLPVTNHSVAEVLAHDLDTHNNNEAKEHRSTEEAFAEIHEHNQARIEKAVAACEFEATPEVRGAIKDYYNDHEKTKQVLETVFSGGSVDLDALSGSESGIQAAGLQKKLVEFVERLEDENTKSVGYRLDGLLKGFYDECAVGQTTIGEEELKKVVELSEKAEEWRKNTLGPKVSSVAMNAEIVQQRHDHTTKMFWKDARQAGQLLFHNTPYASELAVDGFVLGTRANQSRTKGDYRAVTMDVEGHSQSVHFSEEFMTDSYKEAAYNGKADEGVHLGGTVALPLAEVIKVTPYARGGRYGETSLKSESGHRDKIAIHDSVNAVTGDDWYHNQGADDNMPGESGIDRTFYADNRDRDRGEDYQYNFGAGMASDNGNTSKIIYLQRDIDALNRAHILGEKGMEHAGQFVADSLIDHGSGRGYPGTEVMDYDYNTGGRAGNSQAPKDGEAFVSDAGKDALTQKVFGGAAASLRLSDERFSRVNGSEHSFSGKSKQEQDESLRRQIAAMQQESCDRPKFKDKYVVLLRGNDMAFESAG